MKLLSATVRNYRIHREATVVFDPSRTLIGGPNEVGKSTLIEAIHRGLFLKSTVTGEAQKSMVSTVFPGHPEVELRFNAHGGEYHLIKRFSGGSGTAKLTRSGGDTFQGEEAEARLRQILGVEEPGGGRGILDRVARQWAHLWVWQGMSRDDPAAHATSQQSELLQRLQQAGGGVAMQSELDGRVASRFAQARAEIFVRSGNARVGSDLDRAQAELREAEAAHANAAERGARLQQAITDYETAESTLQRTASDLEQLQKQRQALKENLDQAEALQQVVREQAGAAKTAREKLASLEKTEEIIAGLRESIAHVQHVLRPKQDELGQAEPRAADLRRRAGESDRVHQVAEAHARNARLRRDLMAAYVAVHEKRARQADLLKRLHRVQGLQKEIQDLRRQLHQLPSLDRARLEELQELEKELGQANAALSAMAAGVEVISADQPVRVGDRALMAGESRTITEPTDVDIGDAVRLRIHPGGGDSLGAAREQVRSLRARLQSALDEVGLDSCKRASEMVAAREDLQGKIDGAEAALNELDAEGTEGAFGSAQDELTAAEADVSRRLELVQDLDVPDTLAAVKALRNEQEESVQDAEAEESSLRATRDALHGEAAGLEEQLRFLRGQIAEDQQSLTGFEAQLRLLVEGQGDDPSRGKAMDDARKTLAEAEDELERTRKALEDLQPEVLASDRERLDRSVEETNRQQQAALTRRAVSQSTLRSDGADDPKASLAQAEARLSAAREHHQAVNRKAMAIALVDDLFQEQQQALADRFSRPLADKITSYLQRLFGPDARAAVTFEDNAFKTIKLIRSSQAGATAFDTLSGGTREQVAAAVRLAIAELLAAEHEGSLPVVFDDAFAYSDPERVHVLQRMLDLGATRGLQIVVLTCNPSDYAALGARQVTLSLSAGTTQRLAPSQAAPPGTEEPASPEPAPPSPISDEDAGRFLSVLTDLGGRSGNRSLRDKLGWDDGKYTAVKDQLLANGRIVLGRGRGGSVALR